MLAKLKIGVKKKLDSFLFMNKFKYEFEFGLINVWADDVKYFKFNGMYSYFHSRG